MANTWALGVQNVSSSLTTPLQVCINLSLKHNYLKDVLTEYSKIFIFLVVALGLALALVLLNWVLVKKSQAFNKTSIYECGFDNFNSAKEKFTVHFYIIAILFVIFDIEMVFLYAMSYSITITKFFGLFILFSFLAILVLGLIFEWNNGVLNWNKKSFSYFLFFTPEIFQDFFFSDFITFFAIFVLFLVLNFLLIFNRTVSNLLSLVFFLIVGCVFLLISFRAEFIIYSYLLVYVGGISVLFLFGLMSVNQKTEYQKLGLISYSKLWLNLFSCILSFFLYNIVVKEKRIHDFFFYKSNFDSRKLGTPFAFLNSKDSRVISSRGKSHDILYNHVIEGEIDAIGEHIFLGSNPYILLFSMFFLLIALIVSIELCLISRKLN